MSADAPAIYALSTIQIQANDRNRVADALRDSAGAQAREMCVFPPSSSWSRIRPRPCDHINVSSFSTSRLGEMATYTTERVLQVRHWSEKLFSFRTTRSR